MKVKKKPILYVEAKCPRCRKIILFFNDQGVEFKTLDVSHNKSNMDAMVSASKQTKVPTFEYEDLIISDFSVDEFLAELSRFPEIGQKLGISNDES
jgi:glutaredoxin